jgi:hypothetical protein
MKTFRGSWRLPEVLLSQQTSIPSIAVIINPFLQYPLNPQLFFPQNLPTHTRIFVDIKIFPLIFFLAPIRAQSKRNVEKHEAQKTKILITLWTRTSEKRLRKSEQKSVLFQ